MKHIDKTHPYHESSISFILIPEEFANGDIVLEGLLLDGPTRNLDAITADHDQSTKLDSPIVRTVSTVLEIFHNPKITFKRA